MASICPGTSDHSIFLMASTMGVMTCSMTHPAISLNPLASLSSSSWPTPASPSSVKASLICPASRPRSSASPRMKSPKPIKFVLKASPSKATAPTIRPIGDSSKPSTAPIPVIMPPATVSAMPSPPTTATTCPICAINSGFSRAQAITL